MKPAMRALVCDDWCHYRALALREVARPALPAGCVRIQVHFAAVSHGQMLVMEGRYQRRPPRPFSPGSEIAGVVLEAAPDVTRLRPGDRVAAAIDWGGYAEEAIATQETVWPVPPGLPLDVAASLPITWGTAWCALHWRGRLQPGERVAVLGAAGGVGLAAVTLAHRAGARVLAVAGSPERLQIARRHGAEAGLLRSEPGIGARIKAWSGGGADILYDPVGLLAPREMLRAMAPQGRILLIGFAGGEIPQLPANLLLVKNVEALGVFFGHYIGWGIPDERRRHAPRLAEMMRTLFDDAAAGRIVPQVAAQFPLARFVDAFDAMTQRSAHGRVLLRIAG